MTPVDISSINKPMSKKAREVKKISAAAGS